MKLEAYADGLGHVGIPTSDLEKTVAFYEGLGFAVAHRNRVPANGAEVAFLRKGNLVIETYAEGGNGLDGAINHIALNCTDIDAAYAAAVAGGYRILSSGIETLPFWENGVAYFILEGPNRERIEYCQVK